MSEWFSISPTELLSDKPFTNPGNTGDDAAILAFALEQLRLLLSDSEAMAGLTTGQPIFWVEMDGRLHRFIVADTDGLRTLPSFTMVGFFGQRRTSADRAPIEQVDTELISELMLHPGLLAYCSMLLDDGSYGNLVLFADQTAMLHWSTSERHAYATRVLAPTYYESVRLHNGYVAGGLNGGQRPVLERTKYLDYRGMLPWRAIREYVADSGPADLPLPRP